MLLGNVAYSLQVCVWAYSTTPGLGYLGCGSEFGLEKLKYSFLH